MRLMDGDKFSYRCIIRYMPYKDNIIKIVKEINNQYEISMLDGTIKNDVLCCRIKN